MVPSLLLWWTRDYFFYKFTMADDKKSPAFGDQTPKDAPSSTPESGSLVEAAGINEKTLLRKLDLKLLPPLTLLYLLSFLDRSNGTCIPF